MRKLKMDNTFFLTHILVQSLRLICCVRVNHFVLLSFFSSRLDVRACVVQLFSFFDIVSCFT